MSSLGENCTYFHTFIPPVPVPSPTPHRDLKSDSHKRFPTRDFACWAYILDYGESKKGCLNYFRNRSAHTFWGTFIKYNSLLTAKFLSNGQIL